MGPRIVSVLTLGVSDLKRSSGFYEGLGFKRSAKSDSDIVWFITGGTVLALYPWKALADDAAIPPEGSGFRGVTMAINLCSEDEVDQFIDRVDELGGRIVKRPQKVFWGGYSSYFQDADGHLWEVAFNPFTPVDASGRLDIDV
ncbi:MAG: VOC family protein [Methanomassiliicoccus sp.]|nr:VOC family protein [Methanomassiliicoccus sp.]